jgi:phosphoribosylcarboxyaminoimidazole (NCAIR) mutase
MAASIVALNDEKIAASLENWRRSQSNSVAEVPVD